MEAFGSPDMRHPRVKVLVLAIALCLTPACALGEEPAPHASWLGSLIEGTELSGSLRGSYWSSSRSLNTNDNLGVASAWLRGRSQLAPGVSLVADAWLMNDELFQAGATSALLREGYLDLTFGSLDLRVGQQIIAWGRRGPDQPDR